MRYQFKGIAGKWNVFNEAGERIGSVRRSMGRRLEYELGNQRQYFEIRRKGNEIWLEQEGKVWFSGSILYPVDENGKPVSKSLFCPPMPEELKLEYTGEVWRLHQMPDRKIEIYYQEKRVGILNGLVMGTKTLDWSGGEKLLNRGLLCFALGVYMVEDDTVYAV